MFDLEEFANTGVAHLHAAFSAEEAAAMRAVTWSHLEQRYELRQHDPSTWPTDRRGISLKPLKGRREFTPVVANEALREVCDHVFGAQGWKPPGRGPRLLLTFPTPGPWAMPARWHCDISFHHASFPIPAVQLWAFIERVDPGGGGTLLLAGSHRLVDRYRHGLPEVHRRANGINYTRFMQQHPGLDHLWRGGTPENPRRELLGELHEVDGIQVQAIELSGEPGDMFISHGHVFHAAAPNTSTRPRLMMTAMINRLWEAPAAGDR